MAAQGSESGYDVVPLRCYESVLQVWRCCLASVCGSRGVLSPQERSNDARIASVLSAFLGQGLFEPWRADDRDEAQQPLKAFVVTPQALRRCGVPWRGRRTTRSWTRTREVWAYADTMMHGSPIATLFLKGSIGKLVYVQSRITTLRESYVSAALDGFTYFALGRDPTRDTIAWHACRVHHQCRAMATPEVPCEQIGSLMERIWCDKRRGRYSVAKVMDEVRYRDAAVKCAGGQRDEALAEEVASILYSAGLRPGLTDGTKCKRRRRGQDTGASLKLENMREKADKGQPGRRARVDFVSDSSGSSGSARGEPRGGAFHHELYNKRCGLVADMHARAANATVEMTLPSACEKVLRDVTRGGRVQAQALFAEDARTSKKDRAGSTLRETKSAWLSSEDGKRWLHSRMVMDPEVRGDEE